MFEAMTLCCFWFLLSSVTSAVTILPWRAWSPSVGCRTRPPCSKLSFNSSTTLLEFLPSPSWWDRCAKSFFSVLFFSLIWVCKSTVLLPPRCATWSARPQQVRPTTARAWTTLLNTCPPIASPKMSRIESKPGTTTPGNHKACWVSWTSHNVRMFSQVHVLTRYWPLPYRWAGAADAVAR